MKKQRVISIVLLIVMILSLTTSAYAEKDYGDIYNFEKLKKALRKKQSSFKTNEDKNKFRNIYWRSVLPNRSIKKYPKGHKLAGKGMIINNDSVDAYKIFYYGHSGLVEGNTSDRYGVKNYLGYTADGRKVVNLLYNENKMENPKLVPIDKYYKKSKVKYTGQVRPFRTNYTDPLEVGAMYLGEKAPPQDKDRYGRLVIKEWMKNTVARDTGWRREGMTFYEIFGGDVDKFIKHVAITSPPTSRSNGQATVWFESTNGLPQYKIPGTNRSYLYL